MQKRHKNSNDLGDTCYSKKFGSYQNLIVTFRILHLCKLTDSLNFILECQSVSKLKN